MRNLESIDLNLLLLLDWLLKEKNVTAAANRVGVSQPAASRSFQKLKILFGDELLIRTGRTYTLSKLASSLQNDLANVVAQMRVLTANSEDFDPLSSQEAVSIACNDYLSLIGSEVWHRHIHPKAPAISLNWRPLGAEVIEQLAAGTVDLVLAPYAAMPNIPKSGVLQDMVVKPVLDDAFVVFAGEAHPLMQSDSISPEDFAGARHVLVSPQGAGAGIVDQKLDELGLSRTIAERTWSFALAAEIALQTGSVVVLPERFAKLYSKGRTRRLPFDLDGMQSFVAWHASRTSDKSHRWVRDQIREGLSTQK